MTANEWKKVPRALYEHALGKSKGYLESRTPRQRIAIVLCMLILLLALERWFVWHGCSGVEIGDHVEPVQPINP